MPEHDESGVMGGIVPTLATKGSHSRVLGQALWTCPALRACQRLRRYSEISEAWCELGGGLCRAR